MYKCERLHTESMELYPIETTMLTSIERIFMAQVRKTEFVARSKNHI